MTASSSRLILIRHGESLWNREQRFTGWADVDLTAQGVGQMQGAARALSDAGVDIDLAFSSVLRRCIRSQWILLEAMDCIWVPQVLDWQLNERHYGALTGRLKSEAEREYGHAAVQMWRRAYDAAPPPMDIAATAHVTIDRRYADLQSDQIPVGESLRQTVARVRSLWQQSISPAFRTHRSVAVVGHGNSLRALIKILEDLSDDEIVSVEVGNGTPIVYEFDAKLKPKHKLVLAVPPRRTSEIL
ncbi:MULTISPECIES: 2,3-bisphosphoglycerate-dependent phosphoglycerate mutase [unclassified Variovorax]|uniref:2,3-bisphosphoglycerate-dependent phosphoglycerate mutase n=1 Tax=unclassified Variovorax TaxID=663243 RepID=UPI003F48B086